MHERTHAGRDSPVHFGPFDGETFPEDAAEMSLQSREPDKRVTVLDVGPEAVYEADTLTQVLSTPS